jgi:hypothetical protein
MAKVDPMVVMVAVLAVLLVAAVGWIVWKCPSSVGLSSTRGSDPSIGANMFRNNMEGMMAEDPLRPLEIIEAPLPDDPFRPLEIIGAQDPMTEPFRPLEVIESGEHYAAFGGARAEDPFRPLEMIEGEMPGGEDPLRPLDTIESSGMW